MPDGYQSLAIPDDVYEKHKARKEDLGVTWGEYLDGRAPEYPDAMIAALREAVADAAREGATDAIEQARR